MRRAARKTKRTLAVVTLALAGCRGPIQAVTSTPEVVSLRLVASNSMSPLLQSFAATYNREDALVVFVDQRDLGLAADQIANPSSANETQTPNTPPTYALTTYFDVTSGFWAAPLGKDAIAVITHRDLNVESLTAREMRAIFSGNARQWSHVSNSTGEIVVIAQPTTSDTHQVFQQIVLGQRPMSYNAQLAPTGEAMIHIVATTPGAIGYVSVGLVEDQVNTVALAASDQDQPVLPTRENIINQSYPLQMPVLIVGPHPPTPGDGYYEFVLWAQTEGQSIVAEHYVPLAATP